MKQNDSLVKEFLQAMHKGIVCLHPTDTICGLTFLPSSSEALAELIKIKQRPFTKPLVHLVSNFSMAFEIWEPLSTNWQNKIKKYWPCGLTVISKCSKKWQEKLSLSTDTVALRYPKLTNEDQWLFSVIDNLKMPLPSTSVNEHAMPPLVDWNAASLWIEKNGGFSPKITKDSTQSNAMLPSTLIKLNDDDSYEVLRRGSFDLSHF